MLLSHNFPAGAALLAAASFSCDLLDLAWTVASHPAPWRAKLGLLFKEKTA
jgi:hypothetical protein